MIKKREMLVHFLLLLLFLHHLLWPAACESSSASLALPGCPDNCGKIPIPYPFGTRDGCYRKDDQSNQTFLITCNDSYSPPRPFLNKGNIQVYEISLERVVVDNSMASICYNESGQISYQRNASTRLRSWSPYAFSDVYNRFVVLGCNVEAVISDEITFRNSCRTYCDSKESPKNGSCNGIGCCQTAIPMGLKHINISIPTILDGNHSHSLPFAPCSYAFVADKDRFNFSYTDLMDPNFRGKKRYAFPVVYDWAVGNKTCEEARKNSTNFACGGNSTCIDSINGLPGYRCTCLPGYDGNPYLPQGCQDIDECQNSTLNTCVPGGCFNFPGGHYCSCPKGTYGDGKKDGKGCIKKEESFIKIIVAITIGFLAVLISGSWICWGLKQRRHMKLREQYFKQNGGLLLQQQISLCRGETETSKIFTAKELQKATNNYAESQIIGKGGFGTVYKGILADNRLVAIKMSKVIDETQVEQFINEIFILSQINHRNVVKLLGCCLETQVPLLVYEYVPNGTLFHHIHGEGHVSSLSWPNRLRIATETAGALAYLHSSASIPIFHRDVKSTNILLDDNFTAKVSDFGASRLVPVDKNQMTTLVQGTLGYLDPEYMITFQLTEKSDVYSFGVVLVELLTGKMPLAFERSEEERNLSMLFVSAMKQKCLFDILESQVVDEGGEEQLLAVAQLAKRCLKLKGDARPRMKEVAAELEGLSRFQQHPWIQQSEVEMESMQLLGEQEDYVEGPSTGSNSLKSYAALDIDMPR